MPGRSFSACETRGSLPSGEIGLNHLMFASGLGGVGFTVGHSVGGIGFTVGHAIGVNEYAIPGMGGRAPVRWLARPPLRNEVPRRPVVAILDTGVASGHTWFDAPDDDPIVLRYFYDPRVCRSARRPPTLKAGRLSRTSSTRSRA